ncbi:MAG: DUF58 domain-containing protein [Chloroflexi bacterium]|nr:DUF58 domain-containing protein [Chloroflexota bacterium]
MKRIYTILLLLIVTLLLALGSGVPVYFRVFFLTALVAAGSFMWAYLNLLATHVTVNRTYGKLRVGEYLESRVAIHNSSPLPKFSLEINDLSEVPGHNTGAVINLPPFGDLSLVLKIPLMKRGIYRVGSPTVSSKDPFGIFRLQCRGPGGEQLVVLPYMVDIPPFSLSQGDFSGEGSFLRSTPESSASASTLREYRSEDSTRYIHWPATARRGNIMLKQFDGGMEDVAWILLDLQAEIKEGDEVENTEEYAVTAAASIAKSYSQMGWAVGMMSYGDRQYVLSPQEGALSLDRMFVALTEARAEGTVPLRELLVYWQSHIPSPTVSLAVITSSVDPAWGVALESVIRQGVSATAVLIDPTSFGATGDPRLLLSQLQRRGVPTYLLRKNEDIAQALQHPWRLPGTPPVGEQAGTHS